MVTDSNPVFARRLSKNIDAPAGRIDILQDVNFELAAGEAVAILGASGSGKSTLLGLLAGLDDASSGEIRLFGEDLGELDEDGRAALRAGRVGFVFQSFQLLPGMTALENVMLPLELAGESKPRPIAEAALSQVELSQRLHHYPGQLSGGEQQRVAIARAFATQPLLLFADEPTGSLDQATGRRISELIFQLRQQSDAGLLLVTHDAHLAARCDRRMLLENGRLETAV
ncbi:MAG: ATP-binding cassette domain-containing protein [Gammaproteobacteria bacterium]|nr:ATP-binding cassette domain-containing protein [Gammaproteobacteria bacterium]HXK57344.1 ATP-binding cassette domain-containing protein [Gammaproteobacteria bacterium]